MQQQPLEEIPKYNPISPAAMQSNQYIILYARSTLAATAGAAAGILGLTVSLSLSSVVGATGVGCNGPVMVGAHPVGHSAPRREPSRCYTRFRIMILGMQQGTTGFVFFFAASLLMSLLLLLKTGFKPDRFFPLGNGFLHILTGEIFNSLFSYVLFWTLFTGLVHLFE
ncbi:hypothetical protein BC830DRAFT_1173022 [Chytriomyces sp. MP71]|nr:hypothetical protein BC830DRAFT_1173022 [Chytriomyces sp. MP71]